MPPAAHRGVVGASAPPAAWQRGRPRRRRSPTPTPSGVNSTEATVADGMDEILLNAVVTRTCGSLWNRLRGCSETYEPARARPHATAQMDRSPSTNWAPGSQTCSRDPQKPEASHILQPDAVRMGESNVAVKPWPSFPDLTRRGDVPGHRTHLRWQQQAIRVGTRQRSTRLNDPRQKRSEA